LVQRQQCCTARIRGSGFFDAMYTTLERVGEKIGDEVALGEATAETHDVELAADEGLDVGPQPAEVRCDPLEHGSAEVGAAVGEPETDERAAEREPIHGQRRRQPIHRRIKQWRR
jgi:hypothetical protein